MRGGAWPEVFVSDQRGVDLGIRTCFIGRSCIQYFRLLSLHSAPFRDLGTNDLGDMGSLVGLFDGLTELVEL